MTQYHPRNDYVVVVPDEQEKMKSGLYIPAAAATPVTRGTVIAVGPGYTLADGTRGKLDLEEGARVDFTFNQGDQIRDLEAADEDGEDTKIFILREASIIAVVTDEPMPEVELPSAVEEATG